MNFMHYTTQAKYAAYINEGYNAFLFDQPAEGNPYGGEMGEAWAHGYDLAKRSTRGEAA